ncbi:MAG: hypothetical protein L3J89_12415 [Gammaproteobacteria bacterium]|nr:hypothetical protein [Gammaproteobacteria bacterium]
MKHQKSKVRLFLFPCIFIFSFPAVVLADATDSTGGHHGNESSIQIDYFSLGDSKSAIGNTQVGAAGMRIEAEYEMSDVAFSFGFERWKYNWTNPESLPFVSGVTDTPWSTFNTLQFGLAYEQEINDRWELNYYVEAESSYEKETSASREYEAGIDFTYEPSKAWSYTLNVNMEYLDATGGELGVDLEIEWNHDKKEGWSGEFEISSEFPETSLSYHFTRALSTTMFYSENGTNTIRLSDSSPVTGMQGGYFEDEYNSIGMKINYEFLPESYVTVGLQQNSGRRFSFVDSTGNDASEISYEFSDAIEASIGLSYTF